jgi:hypothetical protein
MPLFEWMPLFAPGHGLAQVRRRLEVVDRPHRVAAVELVDT